MRRVEHITFDTSTLDTSTSNSLSIEYLKRLGSSPMRRVGRLMVALALCLGAFTQTAWPRGKATRDEERSRKLRPFIRNLRSVPIFEEW